MSAALWGAAATFCTTLLATFALAALWRSRGWGDGPGGPDGERKLQGSAVPAVGGFAIATGWGVGAFAGLLHSADFGLGPRVPGAEGFPWLGCFEGLLEGPFGAWLIPLVFCLALATGALDDALRHGLSPWAKLAVQGGLGVLLTLHDPTLGCMALALFLSMLSQNALNTFDNADGACAGVSALGLWLCGSPLAPAVTAFLLPNLLRRGTGSPGWNSGGSLSSARVPWAYLGDGGSQLLGVAILLTPGAWPVLALPILDLAHVSWRRVRLGLGPWQGDRRHLAHRLQRAGLGPWAVASAQGVIALPALLAPGIPGVGGTLLAYGIACWATRMHSEPKSARILPTK